MKENLNELSRLILEKNKELNHLDKNNMQSEEVKQTSTELDGLLYRYYKAVRLQSKKSLLRWTPGL